MLKLVLSNLERTFLKDIFTNGAAEKADRLVLIRDKPVVRELGGWGEQVMEEKVFKFASAVREQTIQEVAAVLAPWDDGCGCQDIIRALSVAPVSEAPGKVEGEEE